MRSKQYIQNLVENAIGRSTLQKLSQQSEEFKTAQELNVRIRLIVESKLSEWSAEKLGAIIEYSDTEFSSKNSTAIHQEEVFHIDEAAHMNYIKEGLYHGGKNLLIRLATLTVIAIIFDLLKQSQYEDENLAEWQRAQQGQPPVHLVPKL